MLSLFVFFRIVNSLQSVTFTTILIPGNITYQSDPKRVGMNESINPVECLELGSLKYFI